MAKTSTLEAMVTGSQPTPTPTYPRNRPKEKYEEEEAEVEQGKTPDDNWLVNAVKNYRQASEQARQLRIDKSWVNRNAYMSLQDWSHKEDGQSREFLPKTSAAIEQFTAFIQKALVAYKDWFSVALRDESFANTPINRNVVGKLLSYCLNTIPDKNQGKTIDAATLIGDAVKAALTDSLIILKVHGAFSEKKKYYVERGQPIGDKKTGAIKIPAPKLKLKKQKCWKLCVDIVRIEDYFPDPTGEGLYEIHRVERDLDEVMNNPIYDKSVLKQMKYEDYDRPEDEERTAAQENQSETFNPSFRKRVVIDEFWGTIYQADGRVAYRNIVMTIANDKWIIRKPTPNPFWHQESPFIAEPIIRVPHSVWHKALYDDAVALNFAMNEMFSLMLDGGLASVWGVRTIRPGMLTDPSVVSDGIPQGATLTIKDDVPYNVKVVEKVIDGNAPPDAMAMMKLLDGEFNNAGLTNAVLQGQLPPKEVKATEVSEASRASSITLENITTSIEKQCVNKLLRKAWLTILQSLDDFEADEVISAIGIGPAFFLSRMLPAERFANFAVGAQFEAVGLTGTLNKTRDFQKIMALMQSIGSNPLLMQAFMKKFSPEKTIDTLFKKIDIDPSDLLMTDDDQQDMGQRMQQLTQIAQQLTGGGKGGAGGSSGPSAEETGGPEVASEINQEANPLSGMT